MSTEELEQYEAEIELALYREYRDVIGMFRYVVETERRFYLCNEVTRVDGDDGFLEYELTDAWVWDMYRQTRFLARACVASARALTIEELPPREL